MLEFPAPALRSPQQSTGTLALLAETLGVREPTQVVALSGYETRRMRCGFGADAPFMSFDDDGDRGLTIAWDDGVCSLWAREGDAMYGARPLTDESLRFDLSGTGGESVGTIDVHAFPDDVFLRDSTMWWWRLAAVGFWRMTRDPPGVARINVLAVEPTSPSKSAPRAARGRLLLQDEPDRIHVLDRTRQSVRSWPSDAVTHMAAYFGLGRAFEAVAPRGSGIEQ